MESYFDSLISNRGSLAFPTAKNSISSQKSFQSIHPQQTLKEYLLTPDLEDPQPNVIDKATIRMDKDTFILNPILHRQSVPLVRNTDTKKILKPIRSTLESPISRFQMDQ